MGSYMMTTERKRKIQSFFLKIGNLYYDIFLKRIDVFLAKEFINKNRYVWIHTLFWYTLGLPFALILRFTIWHPSWPAGNL